MGIDTDRFQIVANLDDTGRRQPKRFRLFGSRLRFDTAFQCYDTVLGMNLDAVCIDFFAFDEPFGNRRFQFIVIDTAGWQWPNRVGRVFLKPVRVRVISNQARGVSSSKFAGVVPYSRFSGSVEPRALSSEYGQPSRASRS